MKKKPVLAALLLLLLAGSVNAQQHRRTQMDSRNDRRGGTSVSVIASLPHGAIQVVFGNTHYNYYGGRYYRPYARGYTIVAPPVGIIVPVLPPDCQVIVIGNRRYYSYDNVYYDPMDGGYRVIDRPGDGYNTIAPASGYEKISIDGRTYYKRGGSYYRAVLDARGEVYYEKVGEVQ
jgi:hypothetical protein